MKNVFNKFCGILALLAMITLTFMDIATTSRFQAEIVALTFSFSLMLFLTTDSPAINTQSVKGAV